MYLRSTYWSIIRKAFLNVWSIRIASQEGPSCRMPRGLAWCVVHTNLKRIQNKPLASELWGTAQKSPSTPAVLQGKETECGPKSWYILHLTASINSYKQWDALQDGKAAHTDYRDWHSRILFLCQVMITGKVVHLLTVLWNRKAEWERKPLIPRMKQTKHTSSKSHTWCSLEAGLRSCVNSETPPPSSLSGSPDTLKQQVWEAFFFFYLPGIRKEWQKGSR